VAINQQINAILPSSKCEAYYLFFFAQSMFFREQLVKLASATTIPIVNKNKFENITIWFPPLSEQRAIVTKIEELLSDLENGKQQLLKAQEQLKVYRQSLLKAAFEGRLNYDFCDFDDSHDSENTASSPENHLNHMNHSHHSSDTLPEGWKWAKLGEVIQQPKYGTAKKCSYDMSGKAVLRIPNVINGSIDNSDLKYAEFNDDEVLAYSLIEGDILTIRSNGSVDIVGKSALVKKKDENYLYAGYLIRLRPRLEKIVPKYLLYALFSTYLRNQIELKAKSTSGVNNINSEELKSLILPLCSIGDQKRIVDILDNNMDLCDKIEETITQSLAQAETLKQSIFKKAFEGKLV
jgi:type I restriction enzyme S subunit